MYDIKDFGAITEIFRQTVPGLKLLFLFGSYARGEARENSDIDLAAVVLKRPFGAERRDILNLLYKRLGESRYIADIVFKPMDQFEIDKTIPVTLSHTIATEGKLLWKAEN